MEIWCALHAWLVHCFRFYGRGYRMMEPSFNIFTRCVVCVCWQTEGLAAVRRVGEFFKAGGSSCKVVCENGERCSGTAPVNWHYHVNRLPVVPASSCA